jgi:hypothetical protein
MITVYNKKEGVTQDNYKAEIINKLIFQWLRNNKRNNSIMILEEIQSKMEFNKILIKMKINSKIYSIIL